VLFTMSQPYGLRVFLERLVSWCFHVDRE